MIRILPVLRLAGALVLAAAVTSPAYAGDVYEYDSVGRLSRLTYASGRIVEYSYDTNSNITAILAKLTVSVEPSPGTPAFVNALRASEPNPAYREARLRFSLAEGGKTTLRLFDVSGRLVQTIAERDYPPGQYEVRLFLSKRPAGVYFYRLEAPGFRATRRLVILK